jgi:hypothetical protein
MDSRFIISAYHNYLVNGFLVAGFQLGEPKGDRFFFQALPIEPQEGKPSALISATLFDRLGQPLLRIDRGTAARNPGPSLWRKTRSGLLVRTSEGQPLLSVQTVAFRNCYCTRFDGALYDDRGNPIASGTWKTFTVRSDIPLIPLGHPI